MLLKNIITDKELELEKLYEFLNAYPTTCNLLIESKKTVDLLCQKLEECKLSGQGNKKNKKIKDRKQENLQKKWDEYVQNSNIKNNT